MKRTCAFLFSSFLIVAIGCSSSDPENEPVPPNPDPESPNNPEPEPEPAATLYLGADLSYVNEMQDCGGVYKNENDQEVDPYEFFTDKGANLVRIRLWHSPEWTNYSNFQDVSKSIARAKNEGLKVLLDFHYSDTWADPSHQTIPKAWKDITDIEILKDSLYNYTYSTLKKLSDASLLPEIVQIGNEINREILQPAENPSDNINWDRNIKLLNTGIKAVKDFSTAENKEVGIMLHIAQPEHALWWFNEANDRGISDFDWIGLSYYPKYSTYGLNRIPEAIQKLKTDFGKRVMIVETAYPHTLENADAANNNLGEAALINGYAATPEGQKNYMVDLVKKTIAGGGEGVVYWEPAWISTNCSTPWGQGSHWDNATFFDANTDKALPAFDFYDTSNY
ncbi:arabinogalactan endo-1,4-beta-galactosidase [Gillisia sp. M10.2A]|uniref:Arabinogalactan endo-beta-1,4-galactanase n=1 Tax=Gillisia lutea TaxID=2909668 RepID=A0ABS9ELA2_9FLAO|nr:glycosyl hydrolase 53 family protein [Gillisia lutea]MCF4102555.1 arabinogalactan endo-1,4-beta-galactosidase [Gillisia lutea]